MAGKRSPQSPSISQLTSPRNRIASRCRRLRHSGFQPHPGHHAPVRRKVEISEVISHSSRRLYPTLKQSCVPRKHNGAYSEYQSCCAVAARSNCPDRVIGPSSVPVDCRAVKDEAPLKILNIRIPLQWRSGQNWPIFPIANFRICDAMAFRSNHPRSRHSLPPRTVMVARPSAIS
jgi:hypothetical protein